MTNNKKIMYVISGPSGVGKSTLLRQLFPDHKVQKSPRIVGNLQWIGEHKIRHWDRPNYDKSFWDKTKNIVCDIGIGWLNDDRFNSFFEDAIDEGYEILYIFAYLDEETNLRQIMKRRLTSGQPYDERILNNQKKRVINQRKCYKRFPGSTKTLDVIHKDLNKLV